MNAGRTDAGSSAAAPMARRDPASLDVLHVVTSDARRGAQVFAHDLHLALRERGMRSAIRSLEPARQGQTLPITALGGRRFDPRGLLRLRRQARAARVVVAHGSSTLLACGFGLAGTRTPFVYLSIGDPRFWAATRARRWRAGIMIRRAAAVATVSPGARPALVSHYGLDPAHVHAIPNGRQVDRFGPAVPAEREAARRELGLPMDAEVVAIVGSLSTEKRVDVALDALAHLPGVMAVVAGDGPLRAELESRVAAAGTADRVVFTGTTDGPHAVLAAADVLVLSSDSEGVPGVLVEAGLSALPVVSTDVGWVRDVVVPGRTGVLVPPGRPDLFAAGIREALDGRAELGRAGLEHCRAVYDMDRVASMWERLIADPRAPASTAPS